MTELTVKQAEELLMAKAAGEDLAWYVVKARKCGSAFGAQRVLATENVEKCISSLLPRHVQDSIMPIPGPDSPTGLDDGGWREFIELVEVVQRPGAKFWMATIYWLGRRWWLGESGWHRRGGAVLTLDEIHHLVKTAPPPSAE
jgi:hypothetical protein